MTNNQTKVFNYWNLIIDYCLVIGIWCLVIFPSLAYAEQTIPIELQGVGLEEHLGAAIPLDLPFRNETGETVSLHSFFDGKRPVILTLSYYGCPMLCGLVLNGLTRGLKEVAWTAGEQFQYVNVSIDPTEGPELAQEKKANYLTTYARPGAERGWHFLVGEEAAIRALTAATGFQYRYDDEQQQYAHAAVIVIATPDGRISRYLYGIDFHPRDLRLALLEATKGAIGNLADRFLMFCYHYDPTTRRYGLFATRLMQLGGGITVAGLAVLLTRLRRRRV